MTAVPLSPMALSVDSLHLTLTQPLQDVAEMWEQLQPGTVLMKLALPFADHASGENTVDSLAWPFARPLLVFLACMEMNKLSAQP